MQVNLYLYMTLLYVIAYSPIEYPQKVLKPKYIFIHTDCFTIALLALQDSP